MVIIQCVFVFFFNGEVKGLIQSHKDSKQEKQDWKSHLKSLGLGVSQHRIVHVTGTVRGYATVEAWFRSEARLSFSWHLYSNFGLISASKTLFFF